jgi:hypothetical protein
MDANDHGFFLVLPCNAYSAIGRGRMAIGFLGWITTATAMSSLGAYVAPSPAGNAASPGSLPGKSRDKWPSWP